MQVTFLGTGTSTGIPVVGCGCAVCRSPDPRNQRLRSSVHLEFHHKSIVIDTTPDFRLQVLRAGLERIDAILLTHSHADHLHGLDDIRPYNFFQGRPLDVYLHPREIPVLRQKFSYIFEPAQIGGGLPEVNLIPVSGEFELFGQKVQCLDLKHGIMDSLGFRLAGFAYAVDTNYIPPSSLAKMEGLETLVMSGLKYGRHPTHFSIPESLALAKKLKPKAAYFTHLSHEVEHGEFQKYLKEAPGFDVAYDGLTITLPD